MTLTTTAPAATPSPAGEATKNPNTITLETPLDRGGQKITEVTLRKPRSGELRGVSLTDLLQMDVTALQTVLPRITEPVLHKPDVINLDPADLVQLGTKVTSFLLPKAALADFPSA